MKCPVDNTNLSIAERSGVEIDYCPECRGVWLDRGELDKIIDRAADFDSGQRTDSGSRSGSDRSGGDRRGYESRGYESRGYPPRKKSSFLGELFDF